MKSPCAVNLHNAVTVSQQRLRKRVAQLSSARMNDSAHTQMWAAPRVTIRKKKFIPRNRTFTRSS